MKTVCCFKTVQWGTSRLERHTATHKNRTQQFRFQLQLPTADRAKVATAAALAVALDVR